MKETNEIGVSPNHSSRFGAAVRLFVLHTHEGNGTAQGLAGFLQNPNSGVSYHYSIDNSECVDVVDTDRASWSVLDANSYSINLCFAGSRAGWSRDQWLKYGPAIDYAAKLFVQDAAKYGPLVPVVVGRDYTAIRQGRNGGIDHSGVTYGLGIGDHTDCGPNFPWDVFKAAVDKWLKGVDVPTTPIVNMIDAEAQRATWLGTRQTTGESRTPDGRGRWAKFEHGYIYWTPTTGAKAIPNNVFEVWAGLGFEVGALGYPVNDHTVLPVNTSTKVGDVQAFEGGTIYRKYDQPGYYVHGAIGERWRRDGFENSRWGWPIGNEVELANGGRAQAFEHGTIVWSPDGTIALVPVDGPDEVVPGRVH